MLVTALKPTARDTTSVQNFFLFVRQIFSFFWEQMMYDPWTIFSLWSSICVADNNPYNIIHIFMPFCTSDMINVTTTVLSFVPFILYFGLPPSLYTILNGQEKIGHLSACYKCPYYGDVCITGVQFRRILVPSGPRELRTPRRQNLGNHEWQGVTSRKVLLHLRCTW